MGDALAGPFIYGRPGGDDTSTWVAGARIVNVHDTPHGVGVVSVGGTDESDVDYFHLTAYRYEDVQRFGIRPLRQYPRTDGLAMSSQRRLYPPSRSIQRSLRQGPAGSYQ